MTDHCPTCGQAVQVHTSREGTSSYRPVVDVDGHLCRVNPSLILFAARYARGRETGAPHDVLHAIVANAKAIRRDAGCTQALIEELNACGWESDAFSYRRALDALEDT